MSTRTLLIAAAMLIALTGCERQPPPEETVFDPMVETLERASQAERELQERAKRLEKELEDFETPTPPPDK